MIIKYILSVGLSNIAIHLSDIAKFASSRKIGEMMKDL